MATASGGRPSNMMANSSSSGQFRLAQPSDNAPAPNATTLTPVITTNKTLHLDPMAQSSRPAAVQAMQRPPSTAAPTGPPPPDRSYASSSPAGFGTFEAIDPATNPLLEGVLRPNKDGRVKNPVPSKLKGKTDSKKGNFGVMHMGTSPGKKNDPGRDAAAERDAAARRTSENTASRAKAAQQEKYVPPRRRGLEAGMSDGPSGANPFTPTREDQKQRPRPLAPDETKFEQARLLTLLRSINPITVVDQICKAVAYFGGIPGAPPPEDGIFPESANTRETGALFIGWLAEIFPNISILEAPRQDASDVTQNRLSQVAATTEAPNPRNGFGYGQAISAPAWGLPPTTASNLHITSLTPETSQPSNAGLGLNGQSEQSQSLTPAKQVLEAAQSTASTGKRGRGRPKGSRNKGKSDAQGLAEPAGSTGSGTAGQNLSFVSVQSNESPPVTGAPAKGSQPDISHVQSISDQAGGTKQPQAARQQETSWVTNTQKPQGEVTSTSSIPATIDELSPEERAVLEAFRQQEAAEAAINSLGAGSMGAGLKRKRPPPKPKSSAPPPNNTLEQARPASNVSGTLITPNEDSTRLGEDALRWAPIGTSTSTVSAAKRQRQRNPKAPGVNEPSPLNRPASIASSATPPVAHIAIPDSGSPSIHPSILAARQPTGGLEAHYEKFASRPQPQPQQNGASHAPSVLMQPQRQQQQREQQKPTATASQQQKPALQQQKQAPQMQQQKSQQSSQRDDQNQTQASTRPASTGFYSQRSHGSFSHQFPPNQSSQLYSAHQTSPQMSTSTTNNNTNSYRAANTHALAQTSPQFSQSDNAYRTASPHALSQSSTPFSQPENSFRSASAHTISQAPSAYAQPNFRSNNTHAIPQAPTTYAQSDKIPGMYYHQYPGLDRRY